MMGEKGSHGKIFNVKVVGAKIGGLHIQVRSLTRVEDGGKEVGKEGNPSLVLAYKEYLDMEDKKPCHLMLPY